MIFRIKGLTKEFPSLKIPLNPPLKRGKQQHPLEKGDGGISFSYKISTIITLFSIILAISCVTSFAYSADDMQLFQNADDLRAEGKVHEALALYESILEKSPDTDLKDEILVQMASCYIQLGDEDSAVISYLKAISIDPNSVNAANSVTLMANMYTQRYRFDDLVAIAKQIIQQFPGTESAAMASYRIANSYYSKGSNKEAIEEYKSFITQYPKSIMRSSALNRLIYLYVAEGMLKEAEEVIKQIMAENPNNTYIRHQLALIYRKQGRYDDALELYQKLRDLNPKDADIYEQVGEIYFEKGDKDKAITEWQKITENNPDQYYFHQMLAGIYKSHDLYDLAVQEYEKAIGLQPLASHIYGRLAELHVIRKNYDSALNVYIDALINLPPSHPDRSEIVNNVLELSQMDGLMNKGIERLRTQIAQNANNTSAAVALADIYFYNGNLSESMELYKRIVLLSSDNRNLLFGRAEILRREQRLESAVGMYQTILDTHPNIRESINVLTSIGQLQSELSKPNEAIASLKSAILKAMGSNLSGSDEQIASALMLMGDIYLKQIHNSQLALSAYQQAETIIKRQSDLFADFPKLYLKMADCYRIMGNFDMSLNTLDSIPQEYRTALIDARTAKIKGDTYFNMGDFENADAEYRKATRRNLKEDWANDALGTLALIDEFSGGKSSELLKIYANAERIKEAGQYDVALSEYEKALKTNTSGGLVNRMKLDMGYLLTHNGNYDKAIKTYNGLIISNSQFAPEAQFRIAGIYSQNLNDNQQAIKAYSKLISDYPDSILVSDARKQLQRLSAEIPSAKQNLP